MNSLNQIFAAVGLLANVQFVEAQEISPTFVTEVFPNTMFDEAMTGPFPASPQCIKEVIGKYTNDFDEQQTLRMPNIFLGRTRLSSDERMLSNVVIVTSKNGMVTGLDVSIYTGPSIDKDGVYVYKHIADAFADYANPSANVGYFATPQLPEALVLLKNVDADLRRCGMVSSVGTLTPRV